jgi:hypothetical protein
LGLVYPIGSKKSVEKETNKIMKFLRPALIVALLSIVSAGAALADDIHVIFDPQTPIPVGNFGVVTDPTAIYSFSFGSCAATGIPPAFAGDDGCIALVNESGVSLKSLNLSFIVNAALVGQTIGCDSLDENLTSNDCANIPGPFTLDQIVSVNFFAGDPVLNNSLFVFGETGVAYQDAPIFSVTAPEPTPLTLLAAGMGLIGLCMVFAKR